MKDEQHAVGKAGLLWDKHQYLYCEQNLTLGPSQGRGKTWHSRIKLGLLQELTQS